MGFWRLALKEFTPPILARAIRPPQIAGSYISAAETIASAERAGLSVCDYVEQLHGRQNKTAGIIGRLKELGVLPAKNIVEIGPGTGRYIEHTLKHCQPDSYQIYETAPDWHRWLNSTYPVQAHEADGRTLKQTPDSSCDLVHAHGVFVYTPFLISYSYFREAARVTASSGFVVFDILSEQCLTPELVSWWLASERTYACFLSTDYVRKIFREFSLVETFTSPHGAGLSEYLIFQKHKHAGKDAY
jgi:Methyltransferase domain